MNQDLFDKGLEIRRTVLGREYVDNPEYLSPDLFLKRFYEPAVSLLGPHLAGDDGCRPFGIDA